MIRLQEKKTWLAFFIGLFLLEAILSLWTGHEDDMKIWFNTGMWMNQGINIYLLPKHLGYPPLWALWCSVAYRFYSSFGISIEIWRFMIKLPLIISHLALAFAVGKFAEKRFDHRTTRRVVLFILSWSFFIYVGAIWGQINTLNALLTFLAFYAVTSKRSDVGAFLLGIAVTLKIYPIVTLPAFFAYVFKNQGKKEAGKFVVYACAVPILFTLSVFALFQWDIIYFLRSIFFSTPFVEPINPLQFNEGCMNVWSFIAVLGIDMISLWPLRLLWIPILALVALYWLRKPRLDEEDLILSVISFCVFFMVSYGWVSEQAFIDSLPFVFLLIFCYRRPKRAYLYLLAAIQILIYVFSVANWSLLIFEPFLERFSPSLLTEVWRFYIDNTLFLHYVRGVMGFVVSLSLLVFLAFLKRPDILKQVQEKLSPIFRLVEEFIFSD